MAVTKAKKIEQASALAEALKSVKSGFVTEYGKLTVAQDDELRKAVRGAGAKYRVVKNTLAERAAKGTAFEPVVKDLTGRTSIAYTTGDVVMLAKALTKYAKDHPELKFKAGLVEGKAIRQGSRGAGRPAFQGRALQQAAVPDQRAFDAPGIGAGGCGTQPRGCDRSGCEGKQVCGRRSGFGLIATPTGRAASAPDRQRFRTGFGWSNRWGGQRPSGLNDFRYPLWKVFSPPRSLAGG
jgi:ribosomal protein L10